MEPVNGIGFNNKTKKPVFNIRFLTIAITVFIFGTLGAYLITQSNAAPGNSGTNTYKGQEAISKLGIKLPAVAKQNNIAPEKLKELFLTDPTLEVDDQNNLLYTETNVQEPIEGSDVVEDAAAFNINPAVTDAFNLNSIPGANLTIFLDFDGHTLTGTSWNSLYGMETIVAPPFSIDSDPSTFSDAERQVIISTWAQVANDYAPYNVNVTTRDPGYEAINRSSSTDMIYGTRALISPDSTQSLCGCGGRAYVGVFNRTTSHDSTQPAWVYSQALSNSSKYIAEAVSHEVGHNLGLGHDGTTTASYYSGSGGWGPIMGSAYGQAVSQFSIGDYPNANNQQDDNAIITNVVGVISDDFGNDFNTANQLNVAQGIIDHKGLISTRIDKDLFYFNAFGNVSIKVTAWGPLGYTKANLDPKIKVYSADGILIAESDNPFDIFNIANSLSATINANLPNGKYYLEVDGVGVENLFSDYGSLGYYNITGNINGDGATVNNPPIVQVSATPISGEVPLTVAFSSQGTYDPENTTLQYSWNFGNGATSTSPNPTYQYTASGSYKAVLTVTDIAGAATSKSIDITVSADRTAPTAPANLQAQLGTAANAVNLNWGASIDNTGVKNYQVFRNSTLLATTLNLNFTDVNVMSGNTYSYFIKATDVVGNVSVASNTVSLSLPQPTDTTPPTIPTEVTANAISPNRVDVTWKASTDNVGVTAYYVIRNGVTIATVQGSVSLAYSDTSVQPSTTYNYALKATDVAGNVSASSNIVNVTTSALPDASAPTAPSNLIGNAVGNNQINLAWQPSTDNVAVVGYEVYRNNTLIATVTSTSFGDSGLAPSTTFSYFVKAKDAAGNVSTNSNTVTVTTNAVVTASTGAIAGKVSNSTNQSPVSGATVTTVVNGSRIRVKTDSTGSYRITGLSSGTYSLTVTFKGYNTQSVSASVVSGSTTTLNISLASKR